MKEKNECSYYTIYLESRIYDAYYFILLHLDFMAIYFSMCSSKDSFFLVIAFSQYVLLKTQITERQKTFLFILF